MVRIVFSWSKIRRQSDYLFVIGLILLSFISHAQPGNLFPIHLQDGFPEIDPNIISIAQDPKGFVWFGGETTIQKFDGYSLKTYYINDLFEDIKDYSNPLSPVGFLTDSHLNFWIFVRSGLFIYNHDFDRFIRVYVKPEFEYFYGHNIVKPEIINLTSIMEDHLQNLWIADDIGQLYYFPLDTVERILEISSFPPQRIAIPDNSTTPVRFRNLPQYISRSDEANDRIWEEKSFCPLILNMLQDKDHDIWINTFCRIYRLINREDTWQSGGSYFENKPPRIWWTKNVFLDQEKNFWVGVDHYLVYKKNFIKNTARCNDCPPEILKKTDPYGPDIPADAMDFEWSWHHFPHELGFQGHTGWINNVKCFTGNQIFVVNERSVINYKLAWNTESIPSFIKLNEFFRNENDDNYWKARPSSMLLTEEGVLFSGDRFNGVLTANMNYHTWFRKLYQIDGDENTLPEQSYSSLVDLGGDVLLLGARDNTIIKTSYRFSYFKRVPVNIRLTGNIDNFILEMIPDRFGRIWIRNYLGQLAVMDEQCLNQTDPDLHCSRELTAPDFGLSGSETLHIRDLALDGYNRLWISTSAGLYFINTNDSISKILEPTGFNRYTQFKIPSDSIIFNEISFIIPVKEDFFLLVSEEGWYYFNPQKLIYYKLDNEKDFGKYNAMLGFWFYEVDAKGKIWTSDLYDLYSITFKDTIGDPPFKTQIIKKTVQDGIPPKAYLFVADDHENLWIYPESYNTGIIRYEPQSHHFTNFKGPGIINGTVFGGLHGRDLSGRIYFGAVDGITVFHPDSIRNNDYVPPVWITDVKIMRESIFAGYDSIRLAELKNTHTIRLKPSENVIELEFAALSYANPLSNQYAYYLEGFDGDTLYTKGSARSVTYMNLKAGEYRFYLKGSNNNGLWNKNPTRITIISLPPWYATLLAYIVYTLIIVALISAWRMYDLKGIRLQHKVEIEHAEAEKLRQVDHMKTEFFSNISHEFRTPLTLILGPLENIINGKYIGDLKSEAEMMKRNAQRLLRLINQILSLSRLDAGRMKLKASEQDLNEFIRQVTANFESRAREKVITFGIYLPRRPVLVYFDYEKMEDIIQNVVDNALKFTLGGGKVIIRLDTPMSYIAGNPPYNGLVAKITVQDTGIGIPEEDIDRIFDRFYQVDSSHVRKFDGAGIGLSLVNELVKLHHGSISVQSKKGKGTVFCINLPLGKDHLSEEEIISNADLSAKTLIELPVDTTEKSKSKRITMRDTVDIHTSIPLILVVEDNLDMRQYITKNLDHQFIFIEAENGIQGLQKATDFIPDLIITDLMMPGMDGFELCRKIKEDERSRHIPLIMLTARAGKTSLITGYESGMDDYVIKPFDKEVLLARIRNLLAERKLLREKFTRHWVKDGIEKINSSIDDKFIKRINEVLDKHYTNPNFGTRLFVKEIGLSRSVFYRKLKALTNLSPNVYIRNYRLLKAYQIIREGESDISTAAYNCGFNNLSYFSRAFKQLFKKPPHEFFAKDKLI